MAVTKKTDKGKCPFRRLKNCSEECAFYRKGVRYSEQGGDPIPFEDCAFNIIADNLEAMHNRTYMLQKEVGETKNVMAFKVLADLGMVDPNEAGRQASAIINIPDDKKLIK
jgi:hypothetical protein